MRNSDIAESKINMADDREILREIWDGRVPVCFSLADDEVFTMDQPEPYYVSIINILCSLNGIYYSGVALVIVWICPTQFMSYAKIKGFQFTTHICSP